MDSTAMQSSTQSAHADLAFLRCKYPTVGEILIADARDTRCYVDSNNTRHGRSLSRRVNLVISSDGGDQP